MTRCRKHEGIKQGVGIFAACFPCSLYVTYLSSKSGHTSAILLLQTVPKSLRNMTRLSWNSKNFLPNIHFSSFTYSKWGLITYIFSSMCPTLVSVTKIELNWLSGQATFFYLLCIHLKIQLSHLRNYWHCGL